MPWYHTQLVTSPMPIRPTFPLGRIEITDAAREELADGDIAVSLEQYSQKNWGICTEDEKCQNDAAVSEDYPSRILAVYELPTGIQFWIVTDRLRAVTTIIMPEQYEGILI